MMPDLVHPDVVVKATTIDIQKFVILRKCILFYIMSTAGSIYVLYADQKIQTLFNSEPALFIFIYVPIVL